MSSEQPAIASAAVEAHETGKIAFVSAAGLGYGPQATQAHGTHHPQPDQQASRHHGNRYAFSDGRVPCASRLVPSLVPAKQRGANRLLQCPPEWHCPHVPANPHRRMPMFAHVGGGWEFEVYFPKEKEWFKGRVLEEEPTENGTESWVVFEDGDKFWLFLGKEKVRPIAA